jgi:hypothetical protein
MTTKKKDVKKESAQEIADRIRTSIAEEVVAGDHMFESLQDAIRGSSYMLKQLKERTEQAIKAAADARSAMRAAEIAAISIRNIPEPEKVFYHQRPLDAREEARRNNLAQGLPSRFGFSWGPNEEGAIKTAFMCFCEALAPSHDRTPLAIFKRIEKIIDERRFNHEFPIRKGWER